MKRGENDIFHAGNIEKKSIVMSTQRVNLKQIAEKNEEVEFKPEAKLQKSESNSEERSKKEKNNEEITENNETVSNSSSAQQIEMSQYKVPTQIRPPLPSHNRKK